MLEIIGDKLTFSFPEVHPDAKLTIDFKRTFRIPDDGKDYPLPPSMGQFPLCRVDDFKDKLPSEWVERGGAMFPMYQSEALWMNFSPSFCSSRGCHYPFAIKVAAGKRSAITGDEWTPDLRLKDYCVAPKQPWIDGYVVEKGTIRQFVAEPLGAGFTVEEQLTGKAEFGGIQIKVFPMKAECFERRWPERPPTLSYGGGDGLKGGFSYGGGGTTLRSMGMNSVTRDMAKSAPSRGVLISETALDMGLAAGGRMKQQIFDDPYGLEEWDQNADKGRCFVHLVNTAVWRSITGKEPPTVPFTAAEYVSHGYPWFDFYSDGPAISATPALAGVASVAEMQQKTGIPVLPENQSVKPTKVVPLTSKTSVRDGEW